MKIYLVVIYKSLNTIDSMGMKLIVSQLLSIMCIVHLYI